MTRALAISVVVAFLMMGCVSVGPAQTTQPPPPSFSITTPAPSASATLASTASPAPTATPTQAATPSATVAPTDSASDTPAPPLTPDPSQAVIEDFGADTLIFADDFSDNTSGWGVTSQDFGSIAYSGGTLAFTSAAATNWMWSRRLLDQDWNVVRVEAVMVPSAAGTGGLFCANNDDELFGALVTTSGGWSFVQLTSEGASVLLTDEQAGWNVPAGLATTVALDCAGTATGTMRMQVSLPDIGLGASYEDAEGADSFDRVAIYAESAAHPFSLAVDNVFAYGGEGGSSVSPAARALLLHVPADWRPDCFETQPNPFETGAEAAVSCTLTEGRSNVADFVQFDNQENMDAAYQIRVDTWAVEPTESCETGSNEGIYTIAGTPAGRILCAPQTVGIRFDWTHDELLILSTLTNFDGSYVDTYEDWQAAGPE